jgi:N,N-dimethylformamidase
MSDSTQGGSTNPQVRAYLVYFEGPDGGAVFSVGSIAWCGALSANGYDNTVSRITDNVLRRFAAAAPIV